MEKEVNEELEMLQRGTVEIIPKEEFSFKLRESQKNKTPLKIKAGFDPTAPDLHLGHLVLLRKLRQFQECGHEVSFLIGDFTAMVGDPSGRSETRIPLSQSEVEKNAKTYQEQVFPILDPKRTKVCFNSSWCRKMKFEDVLKLTSHYTVARLLERDDFQKRFHKGEKISRIEFLYPLIQGYDSVALQADIEIGGNDQKFNLLVGRELQTRYSLPPQIILTLPPLRGLDGNRKMSKSYQNHIGIAESPYIIFAKIMSIADEMMPEYFTLLTGIEEKQLESFMKDPFESKKFLASSITEQIHGKDAGKEARKSWEKEKGKSGRERLILPPDTPIYRVKSLDPKEKNIAPKIRQKIPLVKLFTEAGMTKSKSDARRLIESRSVKMGTKLEVIQDNNYCLTFPGEYFFKIGKKRHLKIMG